MTALNQRIDQLERALRAAGPVGAVVTPPGASSMNISTPASAGSLVGFAEDTTFTENDEQSTTDHQGMLE